MMQKTLISLKKIYADTWHLYKKSLSAVIPFSAFMAILTTIIPTGILLSGNKPQISLGLMFFFLLSFFVNLIPTAAIFHQIFSLGEGNKPTLMDSLRFGIAKFRPLALASLLFIFWGVGSLFVGALLAYLMVSLTHNQAFSFVILLPSLALFLGFYFYKPLVILFHQDPASSLKLSFHLVKSHWRTILVALIIPLAAIFAFNLGASYVGVHLFVDPDEVGGNLQHHITLVNEVMTSIVGILSVPFLSALSLVLLNQACGIASSKAR